MKEIIKRCSMVLGIGILSAIIGHITESVPIIGGMWLWGFWGGLFCQYLLTSPN